MRAYRDGRFGKSDQKVSDVYTRALRWNWKTDLETVIEVTNGRGGRGAGAESMYGWMGMSDCHMLLHAPSRA